MSIEFAQVQSQVVEKLKSGNEILAQLQQELSLEEVEKLMADTAEAISYQNVSSIFPKCLILMIGLGGFSGLGREADRVR